MIGGVSQRVVLAEYLRRADELEVIGICLVVPASN
jgi:hypothetical protein